jgi:hypothetical protein
MLHSFTHLDFVLVTIAMFQAMCSNFFDSVFVTLLVYPHLHVGTFGIHCRRSISSPAEFDRRPDYAISLEQGYCMHARDETPPPLLPPTADDIRGSAAAASIC